MIIVATRRNLKGASLVKRAKDVKLEDLTIKQETIVSADIVIFADDTSMKVLKNRQSRVFTTQHVARLMSTIMDEVLS